MPLQPSPIQKTMGYQPISPGIGGWGMYLCPPRAQFSSRGQSWWISSPYRPRPQICPMAPRNAFLRVGRIHCRRYSTGGNEPLQGGVSERMGGTDEQRYKQGMLWNLVEGITLLGGVGGAVAVALGADLVLISLPIALPLLGLGMGRLRERKRIEVRMIGLVC